MAIRLGHAFFSVVLLSLTVMPAQSEGQTTVQGPNQGGSHREIKGMPLDRDFPVTAGVPVTIDAAELGPNGVICISRSGNANTMHLKSCIIVYSEAPKSKIEWRDVEKVVGLPESAVGFAGNRLTVDGRAPTNQRVVVHVTLPADAQFFVIADGSPVGGLRAEANLMVQNGGVVESPAGFSFQAAMAHAMKFKPKTQP